MELLETFFPFDVGSPYELTPLLAQASGEWVPGRYSRLNSLVSRRLASAELTTGAWCSFPGW